jgi:hypothetical protein
MITEAQKLADDIEATAARVGMSPSTVGERAGQGGKFYTRLRSGCRVWPETAEKVRERLRAIEALSGGDAA